MKNRRTFRFLPAILCFLIAAMTGCGASTVSTGTQTTDAGSQTGENTAAETAAVTEEVKPGALDQQPDMNIIFLWTAMSITVPSTV